MLLLVQCCEAMWRTCQWKRTSKPEEGFCLGPGAAAFNEVCWLLASFPLAAPPGHCLSLGRMFSGTGLNLLVGGGLLFTHSSLQS